MATYADPGMGTAGARLPQPFRHFSACLLFSTVRHLHESQCYAQPWLLVPLCWNKSGAKYGSITQYAYDPTGARLVKVADT